MTRTTRSVAFSLTQRAEEVVPCQHNESLAYNNMKFVTSLTARKRESMVFRNRKMRATGNLVVTMETTLAFIQYAMAMVYLMKRTSDTCKHGLVWRYETCHLFYCQ